MSSGLNVASWLSLEITFSVLCFRVLCIQNLQCLAYIPGLSAAQYNDVMLPHECMAPKANVTKHQLVSVAVLMQHIIVIIMVSFPVGTAFDVEAHIMQSFKQCS